MSRTDKDTPYWVRSLRAVESGADSIDHHAWDCVEHLDGGDQDLICTINTGHGPCRRWISGHGPCRRWISGHDATRLGMTWWEGPTRAMRRSEWSGPERTAVRDGLRNAVRDANAGRINDDIDTLDDYDWDADVPTRQTRHSTWAGGWWD